MASKSFYIPNFKKGQAMSWGMQTKATNSITVVLSDDTRTYVDKEMVTASVGQPVSEGNAVIEGDNLRISLDVPASAAIRAGINSYNITREDGKVVGSGFNISVEDSVDEGGNNQFVSLVCWMTEA